MLIRSQNKEILVNFNVSAGIEIAEGTTKTVVTSYITGCSYLLGEYSTREKAMKVLDMVQEAYSENQIMLNFSVSYLHEFKEKTDGFAIFQMPEDSEVEA